MTEAPADTALAYFEWCAPGPDESCDLADCDHGKRTPGCGLDKPELWQQANPAMGIRISQSFIAKERRTLPPAEFARERMGWWDDPVDTGEPPVIDPHRWAELEDTEPDVDDNAPRDTFAIEVDRDQAFASIGAAVACNDERVLLELVQRARGTKWVVAACKRLEEVNGSSVFVIDGGGPAERLIPALEDEGIEVIVAGTSDIAAADAALVEMVNDGTAVHGPQDELDDAVAGSRKRYFKDGGWTIGRRNSETDVTPLKAVSLAAWGLGQGGGPNVW